MGCTQSTEDAAAKARNAEIDEQLKRDRANLRNEIKMLLLGAGESGKSTVLKQMRLIYNKPYDAEERDSYREIVYSNTVQSMRVLLDGVQMMEIPVAPSNQTRWELIMAAPPQIEGDIFPPKLADAVAGLWRDAGVQQAFERRNELQLNDSAPYYFDAIARIAQPNYMPTDQDILRARVKTTGITETHFKIGELTYKLFDVGGQRSERRKWLNIFDSVTALVFLIAISEYDQKLYEDETVNRMQEAMTLFESVANSRWFTKTSIILFLNKIDLFRAKLPVSPLSNTFPEYRGGSNYDAACSFLLEKFVSLNKNPSKSIYAHYTDATDTKALSFVISAINDVIIQVNLRDCGLL
ncbi:guanine nucleotide-binding protein subunit alpha [Kwoniella heveanensis CBS 569]|uniref:Guanine nucleotide-binding protein subunit alpha n=1 Tax=Kwoniella heveanensis BCC8398 TaxID=1296120 RepID=A0A1B9H0T0_9TREE|nr:guanine nucleotide-binding protein subunit alpha [Kwoniella heveanensis BCC8398]OCF42919.1 guanine nucleotide-binding protein subunit alpha [Kwoniella heveanensis CBS 569]